MTKVNYVGLALSTAGEVVGRLSHPLTLGSVAFDDAATRDALYFARICVENLEKALAASRAEVKQRKRRKL